MEAALGENRRRYLVVAALICVVTLGLLLARSGGAGLEHANAGDEIAPLDHFLCYQGNFEPNDPAPITLEDQFFSTAQTHTVREAKWFCNPTNKEHGPFVTEIFNENNHLTAYQLGGDTPKRRLHVINQFQTAVPSDPPNLVTEPKDDRGKNKPLILAPTKKGLHDPPSDLDHFKCYEAEPKKAIDERIRVEDQFLKERTTVGKAKFLCNPAAKVHGDDVYEITNPIDHLVCYAVKKYELPHDPPDPVRPLVDIENQFIDVSDDGHFTARTMFMICVPSEKYHVGG